MITIVHFCSSKSNFDLLLQLHKSVCNRLSHETGRSYLNKSVNICCVTAAQNLLLCLKSILQIKHF